MRDQLRYNQIETVRGNGKQKQHRDQARIGLQKHQKPGYSGGCFSSGFRHSRTHRKCETLRGLIIRLNARLTTVK